jgi:iron complex outermembrane receptor protein
VGLGVIHYDARYGIPSDTTFIDMRQTKVLTRDSIHIGAGTFQTLNLDAGYGDYRHDEKQPDGTIASTFKNREWDGRAEALFGALGPLTASAIGIQLSNRDYSAGGDAGDFVLPSVTRTGALFAFTEAPLGGSAHLQAAVRVERARVEGTPASDVHTSLDFTPVSGSLGVLFDLNDAVKLGLTLTSAARAPNLVELFARGPHDGPGTFETGDPKLDTERANSLEATMRVRQDRFRFEGALWGALFSKYIFGHLTGRTCEGDGTCFADDTHELRELFYEQQDAHFWGVEGRGTYDLTRQPAGTLQAVVLADYVRAQFANGGGDVPRIQPYRIGGGFNWNSDPLNAGIVLLYVGKQDHVPVGDSTTDSYISLDAQVGWRPFSAQKGFEVALIGHNLTDDKQHNAVALNRDVVELPGRDVRLVLRQSF